MLEIEVLVFEGLTAINTHLSSPIAVDEIAALDHEVLDHSVESRSFVTERKVLLPVFSGAELSEVLCCLRTLVLV